MNATKLTLLLSCLLSAMTCAATKYQIKVLNTPSITIDNRQAKVGDWFDDTSVISWTKENQAMRVLSDENKVYTLSAKLYKEAKAKKFSDFIAYTKPLAVRGANDDSLIAQLQERFDQDFIMLDEIVIDLSDIDLPEGGFFLLEYVANSETLQIFDTILKGNSLKIAQKEIYYRDCGFIYDTIVSFVYPLGKREIINSSLLIEVLPTRID